MTNRDLPEKPPEYLSQHAKSVYKATVKELAEIGRPLQRIHQEALIGLSEASSLVRKSGKALQDEDFTIDGGREGSKRNPALAAQISALASVRAFANELGLTPSSQRKLPPLPPKEENPFDEF